jgi:hypothetical protein
LVGQPRAGVRAACKYPPGRDKLPRGMKPADIPVEQPTRFEAGHQSGHREVVGIEIPPSLLARAIVYRVGNVGSKR